MTNLLADAAARIYALSELSDNLTERATGSNIDSGLVRRLVHDIAEPTKALPSLNTNGRFALPYIVALGPERIAGILNLALAWSDSLASIERLKVEVAVEQLRAIANGEDVRVPDEYRVETWRVEPMPAI